MHLADAYTIQRKALEAEYEGNEDAPFVAGVIGVADEEGDLKLTVTTWTDGVRAFLPRAQVIGIGRLEGETGMVAWEDVMELAGHLLEPVSGISPPRWKTIGFPDEPTLRKLMARKMEKKWKTGTKASAVVRASSPAVSTGSASKMPLALPIAAVVVIAIAYAAAR